MDLPGRKIAGEEQQNLPKMEPVESYSPELVARIRFAAAGILPNLLQKTVAAALLAAVA